MIKNKWCIRMNQAIRGRSGPDWNWRSGTLDDYDIFLPFEGEGTIEGDGFSHSVVKGDCFLLRKGVSYTAIQKEGSHLKCLGMHFDFLGEDGAVIEPETIPPFHRSLTNADFVIALADRAVDAWRRDNPIQRDLQALQIWGEALFDEIIKQDRAIQETGLTHAQRVAIERMCAEFSTTLENTPSIEQLADQMGCSRWQFCRIFKRHTGETPQTHLLKVKIDAAKSLLEMSNLRATQIAARLGYSDASHFNKHFRRHTGFTPIEYRTRMR
jgi:AraC-like DNA-binding protein